MTVWKRLAAAIVIVVIALVTAGAQATHEPYSGISDYRAFCSSCHGDSGRGDGVIAKSLKKRPADLTQISKRNNGVFPEERVFKTVDGRQPDGAHRNSDMPEWGEVLAKASESAGAVNAAARIDELVKYLQTLQTK